jgi:membrane fusion protein, multidrug efflux system
MHSQPVQLQSELPGRTTAHEVAEVRPQVGGIIRNRLFAEGSAVRAGQVLYQIDPAPYEADLEQAEAALASARAAARVSELLVQRYRQLLPAQTISQQDFDNAEATYGQAQATVRQRQAAANSARINLQWTRVTAPIGGRTGRSVVTPGALVSANQAAALTTISQLDPIYVDLTQSSAELLRLRQAAKAGEFKRGEAGTQKVSLVMEDGSAYPLEGRIQLSEVTVDSTTGSVLLRAIFPNPEGLLLPGMYVRAVVTEGRDDKGLLVPQQAISRDRKGNAQVRIVNAEGKLELRALALSRAIGSDWIVTSGLADGDRVVVEGAASAPPGSPVEIVEAGEKPAAKRPP